MRDVCYGQDSAVLPITYIPHKSIITGPMIALLCKDVTWQWEHEHDIALDQVKAALAGAPVLQFYNVKAIRLQADASQSRLGVYLLQDGKPIAYASRCHKQSLTRV